MLPRELSMARGQVASHDQLTRATRLAMSGVQTLPGLQEERRRRASTRLRQVRSLLPLVLLPEIGGGEQRSESAVAMRDVSA